MASEICKFKNVDMDQLWNKELDELKECGCNRCQKVYAEKDYQRLQAFEQEKYEEQKAIEQGLGWGQALEKAAETHQKTVQEKSVQAMTEYLGAKGIDLNMLAKAPFFQRIPGKKVKGLPQKNFYVGRGFDDGEEHKQAFLKYIRTGNDTELKALSEGVGSAGGYAVPTDMLNRIIEKRAEASAVLRAGATVERVSGDRIELPVQNGLTAGSWVAENADLTTGTTEPSLNQVVLTPYTWGMTIALSRQLLRDEAVNLDAFLSRDIGRAAGKALDAAFINGTGTGQPTGILQSTTPGITTQAASATLTGDDLITAYYSVAPEYQESGVWIMNAFTAELVRKLKDGGTTGRYLWDFTYPGGITEGQPARLIGRPVYVTNNVPHDPVNGDKIIFGDISYYYVAENQSLEVMRDDSVFFDRNQVAIRGLQSVDGNVALGEAFNIITGAK